MYPDLVKGVWHVAGLSKPLNGLWLMIFIAGPLFNSAHRLTQPTI